MHRKHLWVVLALLFVQHFTAWSADELHDLDITVTLYSDGHAAISEVYDYTHDEESSTYYCTIKPHSTIMRLVRFGVSEKTGRKFTENDSEDWSQLEDRENQCALINYENGNIALVWGLGKPGRHEYTVSYDLVPLVKMRSDGLERLNYSFYMAGNPLAQHARLRIKKTPDPFTQDDILQMNGNDGNCNVSFDNGVITYETLHAMASRQALHPQIVFAKGTFDLSDYNLNMSVNVTPEEMNSPMMKDTKPRKYQDSWWDKFCDFFAEHALLCVIIAYVVLTLIYYILKKTLIRLI